MLIMPGRLPLMRDHALICEYIDYDIKKKILAAPKPKEDKAASQSIPEMFRPNPTLHEESDIHLTLFVICKDLPFR